jgi:hypothetical protein
MVDSDKKLGIRVFVLGTARTHIDKKRKKHTIGLFNIRIILITGLHSKDKSHLCIFQIFIWIYTRLYLPRITIM